MINLILVFDLAHWMFVFEKAVGVFDCVHLQFVPNVRLNIFIIRHDLFANLLKVNEGYRCA